MSDAQHENSSTRRSTGHVLGLARSLLTYYAVPFRAARLAALYADLVPPEGLAFDIGAHVGNRLAALRRAGARVVAVEPHPDLARLLRRLYGHDAAVTIIEAAVGRETGRAELLVADRTPTVSTLSGEWQARVARARAFARVRWNRRLPVEVTTLDALAARFGEPAFVKLDIEGGELAALEGLSYSPPLLSFEYVPAALDDAAACVDRLEALAPYRYNWSVGESHRLGAPAWIDADGVKRWLADPAACRRPGDIYARRATRSR